MAASVFGFTITADTLRATGEYEEPITQKDVAEYTMKMINADGKDKEAQQFVDNLKESFGWGVSVKWVIYNATGTTLHLATTHDWHGHVYDKPYPSEIQNGQWGAFLHVRAPLISSHGAVVYRSKLPDNSSESCDWLLAWFVPVGLMSNKVYTEIRGEGSLNSWWNINWSGLQRSERSSSDERFGYVSKADIGEGSTINARAILQLPKE